MGLEIYAYSQAVDVGENKDENDYDVIVHGNHSCFQHQQGKLKSGFYKIKDSAHCLSMSYSGYNRFRDTLAEIAYYNYEEENIAPLTEEEKIFYSEWAVSHPRPELAEKLINQGLRMPFLDLIFFSDCEGVINTKVAAQLSKDFDRFENEAKKIYDTDPFFYEQYNRFKNGIKTALNDGFLIFS